MFDNGSFELLAGATGALGLYSLIGVFRMRAQRRATLEERLPALSRLSASDEARQPGTLAVLRFAACRRFGSYANACGALCAAVFLTGVLLAALRGSGPENKPPLDEVKPLLWIGFSGMAASSALAAAAGLYAGIGAVAACRIPSLRDAPQHRPTDERSAAKKALTELAKQAVSDAITHLVLLSVLLGLWLFSSLGGMQETRLPRRPIA